MEPKVLEGNADQQTYVSTKEMVVLGKVAGLRFQPK